MLINLGDSVRHKINGFDGVVIGRAEYLTGCSQCLVLGRSTKEDGESRSAWVDEVYLERDGHDRVEVDSAQTARAPGGPLTGKAPPKP